MLSFKEIVVILSSGIWIYYRTSDCYYLLERKNTKVCLFTMGWTYLFMKEPLVLPLGLIILACNRK